LAAKQKKHREAQRRYRKTPKGKKTHCEAENRRRYGLSQKKQKKMDDATSTRLPAWCIWLLWGIGHRIFHAYKTSRCHFCQAFGQIVDEFPRRGYG